MADKPIFNARYRGQTFALYSSRTSDEEIRQAFLEAYGVEPEQITTTGGGKLAGPKPPPAPIVVEDDDADS